MVCSYVGEDCLEQSIVGKDFRELDDYVGIRRGLTGIAAIKLWFFVLSKSTRGYIVGS